MRRKLRPSRSPRKEPADLARRNAPGREQANGGRIASLQLWMAIAVLLPKLFAAVFAGAPTLERRAAAESVERLGAAIPLAGDLGAFVHVPQIERGVGAGPIASGFDPEREPRIERQRAAVDARAEALARRGRRRLRRRGGATGGGGEGSEGVARRPAGSESDRGALRLPRPAPPSPRSSSPGSARSALRKPAARPFRSRRCCARGSRRSKQRNSAARSAPSGRRRSLRPRRAQSLRRFTAPRSWRRGRSV